ncbi:GIY-YIG nuclease family protein [Aureibaculum luteum]|uniref:GIY-YIG nuclease family protein n=1 Tax=Aureibaculum luteum TaxID=1548456 RepID=UPI000E4F46E1|nr:GIY-YIG nuclease family protein [Aureibaculum luteum]
MNKKEEIICRKTLFWISSADGNEDWFVVGMDEYLAELHFSEMEGYELEYLSSKVICKVEFEDRDCLEKDVYFPSHEMLIKNGFHLISDEEPMIFWKDGIKYCQGDIRKNIIIENEKNQKGVYIISIKDSGLFKIGLTKNIEKRLRQLQTGNPFEYRLVEFFHTPKFKELEKTLHKKYVKNKYKNEWYLLTSAELLEACYFSREYIGRPYANKDLFENTKIDRIEGDTSDLPF